MLPRSLLLVPVALAGYALLAFPGIGFLLAIFGGLYLPPLRKYGPRLLKLYARSNWHWIREDDELLTRFGELGSMATPVLVEEYQGTRGAALTALCLAGTEAKAASPDLLGRVANPVSRFVNARAEIITLARMGLYDQAMAATNNAA